jgi:ParB-like chromosome segregation protein Spo0J
MRYSDTEYQQALAVLAMMGGDFESVAGRRALAEAEARVPLAWLLRRGFIYYYRADRAQITYKGWSVLK